MSEIAIRVEGLSKKYRIGEQRAAYRTIREVITEKAKAPFVKMASLVRGQAYGAAGLHEEIWALKDVSFIVKEGEVLGVVGPNGAGKTTLLRMLSRITEPTEGRAVIRGRVGSLLEVGIGMHHELTGRENIYLNGAIMGMKKREIEKRFDDIVGFSGVEKFIDTPIKHYSMGMQVRLAFSVAAHLSHEILLVDEVLAVGDVEFQKRCMGKMGELATGGRTVLFVSHNMAALRKLCDRGILLDKGKLMEEGNIGEIADKYKEKMGSMPGEWADIPELKHFDNLRVNISSTTGKVIFPLNPLEIAVSFRAKEEMINGGVYVGVYSEEDELLFGLDYYDYGAGINADAGEAIEFRFMVEELPLMAGDYYLKIYLKNQGIDAIELVNRIFPLHISEGTIYDTKLHRIWRGRIALRVKAEARHAAIP